MKRFICFLLACTMMISTLCVLPVAASDTEQTKTPMDATFEMAYGGATGIFSMTFDDGDIQTANWLNEMFEKYDLYGSTMNIPHKNFATEELVQTWHDILGKGRLESESHSMTHAPLPAQWWSNYSKYETNNTPEKYQYEIVDAYNRILEVTGRAPLCFAPSNNTLHDDAVKVVTQYHYAMRQGLRWNIDAEKYQSLDPIVNATYNSHEINSQTAGAGGWYNPYMMSFASNPIKDGLDVAANEGAWLITMCHDIGAKGDVNFDVAIDFFEHAAKLQNEGKLWVTTFGNATKYIRERQNSTVSAVMQGDEILVTVTMADKTADDLPLPESIFNHPLTVKLETPSTYTAVSYLLDGARKYTKTFVEGGKTYALVDIVPNSGEICVVPTDLGISGVTPNMIGTILPDGTLQTDITTVEGDTTTLAVDRYGKVYAKLDLSDFAQYNYASVVLDIADEKAQGTIHVYGIADKTLASGWSATSIHAFNAPANDRFGPSVDLTKVLSGAPLASVGIDGAGSYLVDITMYALEMIDLGATAGTLIFVLDESSTSQSISFAFQATTLYNKTINFDTKTSLTFPAATTVEGYRAADLYCTGNLPKENLTLVSDTAQTNALKVSMTESKWNLFKILNLFPEQLTTQDIGRRFVITFKMKETDSSNAKVNGIRMGMVGTHTSGVNCGNVGGGTAPNVGTQYNSVVIKNTALDTWETFTYEFEVTEDTFAGTRPAQELGFYGNVAVVRTLWFDDIVIEEKAPESKLYGYQKSFEDATVGTAVTAADGFARYGFSTLKHTDLQNATASAGATKAMLWQTIGKSWERLFFLGASPYGASDSTGVYTEDDIGRQFNISFMINSPAPLKLGLAMAPYANVQYSALPEDAQKVSFSITEAQVNTWIKVQYTYTVTEAFLNEEIGHYTTLMVAMSKCTGASDTTPVDFYMDDFRVYESPAALYSHEQDCESYTTDAHPEAFTKLGFGTFKVVETMNATPTVGAKKAILYESIGKNYERIYYLGATPYSTKDASMSYTQDDIGRTFRISFKVNTPAVTTFNMAMVCYANKVQFADLTNDAQKASFTVTEDQINTWVKVEYTFTVTEAMLAEDGHFTEFLLAMSSCRGASSTNIQQIYLDDFKSQEIPSGASITVMTPTEYATVGSSKALTVSYLPDAQSHTNKSTYITFDKEALSAVTDGKLRLTLSGGEGQMLRIVALRHDLLAKLSEAQRYQILAAPELDSSYIWHGFDLYECSADAGEVAIDVADYLKAMENIGASFLILQRDRIDSEYFAFKKDSIALTAGVDYTASVGAQMQDGVLSVKAGSIALGNILADGELGVAEANMTYVVDILTSADVKATFLGTSAIADENGKLTLVAKPTENLAAPELVLEGEGDFTVTSIRVRSTTAPVSITQTTLRVQYATDADYLSRVMQNVSLETSICVNFYLPTDTALKAVMNENGVDILKRDRIQAIGDKTYYAVTTTTAPKDAYKPTTLTVIPEIGRAYVLDASILHYAEHLLALEPTSSYILDSQQLAKYILNYIREAALALGDATEESVKAFETDIRIDKTLHEQICTDLDFLGVDGFCLDLDNYIGIVIKVENGFVGTVSASLEGVSTREVTFTEDTPADEQSLLVIENIPAHALRRTVTITVTDETGTTSTHVCNVATYVKNIGSELLYATYAYSVEAGAYVAKYPTPDTAK